MMRVGIGLTICALLVAGCDKGNSPTDTSRTTSATGVAAASADNTKVNERDRNGATATPGDQANNSADIDITAQIRKSLVSDGSLSTDAKNVKVITQNGNVVLRGPVKSDAEKSSVASKAMSVAGVKNVENDLDVVVK